MTTAAIDIGHAIEDQGAKCDPWAIREDDYPSSGSKMDRFTFLLRYAVLAPSVYNTQPWVFAVTDQGIRIFVNLSAWLKVADWDQRDMYLSIGCAIENLVIAADRFGFAATITYLPDSTNPTLVAFVKVNENTEENERTGNELFKAIPRRHTHHDRFDAGEVQQHVLNALQDCCTQDGVRSFFISDPEVLPRIAELLVLAEAKQFADPVYTTELLHWINQGNFGPSWLLKKLSRLAAKVLQNEGQLGPNHWTILKDAPVFGILAVKKDNPESRLCAGRAFERLFLTATSLGLSLEPMTNILQVPKCRMELAKLLPSPGLFPQMLFRLGNKAANHLYTSRRPIEESTVVSHPYKSQQHAVVRNLSHE